MKTSTTREAVRRWSGTAAAAGTAALLLLSGCSRTNEPEARGTISLRFYIDQAKGGEVSLSPAQLIPDSAAVHVFRGGTGANHETASGVAISGAGEVDLTVTCVAENDKKVSVELFRTGTMLYFGVDEHVDVTENENTDVLIDAYDIRVGDIQVTDPLIEPGDPPIEIHWDRVPAAQSYLLLECPNRSFEQHITQSFLTTDTVMTRSRPAGPWYYVVAPLNPYTVGSPSNIAYAYVASTSEPQPRIDSMNPTEVAPGDHVTLDGQNLDVPGQVRLGIVPCPVVSATETQLVFSVPASGVTASVSFENLMNTIAAPGILVVDRIAFVTRTNQDASDAGWYVDLVSNESTVNSGVAVVPLADLSDRDMRVFDVIILADDLGGVSFGLDRDDARIIAESGANVLAIGRGGQAFVSLALAALADAGVIRGQRQDLYVLDGSLPLLQSPHQIAPVGASTVQMSVSNQPFAGIDITGQSSSVTGFAALSQAQQNSFALLEVETISASQQTIHNVYWGYEGYPEELTAAGSGCVANAIYHLVAQKLAVPAAPARAPR
jgi:hypothetical protein